MKLHEYQARDLLAKFGIPVTGGGVASTPAEARAIAEQIGGKVVVKAQVFVGGRGKAGGVKLADTPEQAEQVASQILGMDIKGLTVEKVLVAEAITYDKEIYLSAILDRSTKQRATTALIALTEQLLPSAAFALRVPPVRRFVIAADELIREALFGQPANA